MITTDVMTIKAQFRVDKVADTLYGQEITASAFYGTGPENNDYSKWTPSGQFTFLVTPETHVYKNLKPGDFFIMSIDVKRPIPENAGDITIS